VSPEVLDGEEPGGEGDALLEEVVDQEMVRRSPKKALFTIFRISAVMAMSFPMMSPSRWGLGSSWFSASVSSRKTSGTLGRCSMEPMMRFTPSLRFWPLNWLAFWIRDRSCWESQGLVMY
jgi:hypothetical protein